MATIKVMMMELKYVLIFWIIIEIIMVMIHFKKVSSLDVNYSILTQMYAVF